MYNSLYELPDQAPQARCVASAARLLRNGGKLVIEASAPNRLHTPAPDITFSFKDLTTVVLQFVEYDHLVQIAEYRHVFLGADPVAVMPTVHRYIYLPELDLMAALAGLELADRYSDWNRGPFDSQSPRHISVYAKPGDQASG